MAGPPPFVRRLAVLGLGIGSILLAPPGQLEPASAAVGRDTTSLRALTINGGTFQSPPYGSVFAITGTAPVGETVSLHFHKAGTPATDYSIVRTVTADNTGFWIRPIAAIVDYRYYATDDALTSPRVLNAR